MRARVSKPGISCLSTCNLQLATNISGLPNL